MNTVRREIKVKRVSSCKRSRDIQRSHLTPAKKRVSAANEQLLGSQVEEVTVQKEQLQVMTVDEYCDDSEDLFGDYDSILGDGSFVSKLEDVERNVEEENPVCAQRGDTSSDQPISVTQHSLSSESDFTALKAMGCDGLKQSHSSGDAGILNGLRDGLFENLPSSQLQFQEVTRKAAQDRKGTNAFSDGGNPSAPVTKTPLQIFPAPEAAKGRPAADPSPLTRRSVVDHLKKAMVENASVSSPVISRTTVQRRAIVTEEIGVAVKTMESVSMEIDLGPFFGLPSKVRDLIFKLRGIEDLYDWQKTCLTLDSVQQRKNLIYSLPTSGGKTLVAEVLILKELLCRRMDALFILPYISLVQEKVRGLAGLGLELGFLVEEYAGSKGNFPPVKRRTKKSLYIATIEKGHSLINSLVEAGRLDSLGLLVVDELHMLGEESRGAVLEMTLAKVLYASPSTQIIGMSATLSNIGDLQTFLKADHFTNDFRPVKLVEYVKLRESIYEVHPKEEECFRFSRLPNFKYSSSMQKVDPDHIIALVTEVIPMHSCLVFCPSKKNCENVATMICKYLKKDFLLHWKAEKGVLLQELQASGHGSLCPVLQRTVPFGLAYHHSGLTSEERRLVEEAYSAGVLCLLTCTSTLAAGINLPARRVILRSPYVATEFLKRSQYKQMVGRAGRAGIDTMGESILILQEKDKLMAKELVSSPMESCFSSLMHDNGRGLLSLILSLVGLDIATTLEQLVTFMTGTLLSTQKAQTCSEKSLEDITQESVGFLQQKGLLGVSAECEDTATLRVTKLGRATYKGSIHLTYCEALYRDLSKGLEGLLLNSYLHLVYLVTPYDMVSQCKPDWMVFYRQFSKLSAAELRMAAALGVPESFVARRAAGQSVKKPADAAVVNRLYLALVLFSLLKETDLWAVAERFQLTRGYVQSLLGSASAHCSCVLHFAEELEEFWPYKALLTELTRRLTYCVQAELIPLMEVAGVQEVRAKQLYAAGYKTLSHLASANPDLLITAVQNLSKRQANQIVASAKMLLIEKAEALQEEVNDLLTTPPDLPS